MKRASAKRLAPIERLSRSGPLIGMFDEVSLADTTISLAPGDVLVAYTDGLTETFNAADEMFGDERLIQITRAHPMASAQELVDAIMAQVTVFAGQAPQSDDITLLVMRCQSS